MSYAAEQLSVLRSQEQRAGFTHFNLDTIWDIDPLLRAELLAAQLMVSRSIRRNGHSSYYVHRKFRAHDDDLDSRLDIALFAARGGAFLLNLGASGRIGTAAISGPPQIEGPPLRRQPPRTVPS
jgi:uncharacterized protein (UPF0303 family)